MRRVQLLPLFLLFEKRVNTAQRAPHRLGPITARGLVTNQERADEGGVRLERTGSAESRIEMDRSELGWMGGISVREFVGWVTVEFGVRGLGCRDGAGMGWDDRT